MHTIKLEKTAKGMILIAVTISAFYSFSKVFFPAWFKPYEIISQLSIAGVFYIASLLFFLQARKENDRKKQFTMLMVLGIFTIGFASFFINYSGFSNAWAIN